MKVDTLYVEGGSVLHRLNPLTKITFVTAALVVAFAREDGRAVGPVAAFLVVLVAGAAAGVLRPLLRSVLRIVLPILMSLYLLQFVIAAAQHVWGLQADLVILGVRLLVFVAAILLVLLTTHPARLIQALAAKGAPSWLGYVVAAALQILPVTLAQARAISDAQRTRGLRVGTGSVWQRARAVIPLMSPLLLGVLSGAEEQAMALEARGFSRVGPRSGFVAVEEAAWEPWARWCALVGAAIGFVALRGLR